VSDFAEADRWAASTHEGIDRADWLHAQAYLALRAENEKLEAERDAALKRVGELASNDCDCYRTHDEYCEKAPQPLRLSFRQKEKK
jgi:hypothetical protein